MLNAYEAALSVVALITYYFGFFFGLTPRVPRINFSYPRRLRVKISLIVIFAAVVFTSYMYSQGGITQNILSWANRSQAIEDGRRVGHWAVLIQCGICACLIWLAIDLKSYHNPFFWVCALSSLVMNFLSTGSRVAVINFMLVGLIIWLLNKRSFSTIKIGIAIVLSVLLISTLGEFRRSTWQGEVDWTRLTKVSPVQSLITGKREMDSRREVYGTTTAILARVPHEVDLLYGRSYMVLLTFPIPRALWKEKPRSVGTLAGKVFFGTITSRPPGPVGEAYWNFHIPGVLHFQMLTLLTFANNPKIRWNHPPHPYKRIYQMRKPFLFRQAPTC